MDQPKQESQQSLESTLVSKPIRIKELLGFRDLPPIPEGRPCDICSQVTKMFFNMNSGRWRSYIYCESCKEKNRADSEKENLKKQLLNSCGFSKIHESISFLDLGHYQEQLSAFETGKNIYLYGPAGTGKTHLAVGLLKLNVEKYLKPGKFKIIPELMIELRRAIGQFRESDFLDDITNQYFLVLDDLGVERSTPAAMEALYLIIDRWYRDMKGGLIMTSNYSLDEIADRLDDRIASRISAMCKVFKMDGPDMRLKKK